MAGKYRVVCCSKSIWCTVLPTILKQAKWIILIVSLLALIKTWNLPKHLPIKTISSRQVRSAMPLAETQHNKEPKALVQPPVHQNSHWMYWNRPNPQRPHPQPPEPTLRGPTVQAPMIPFSRVKLKHVGSFGVKRSSWVDAELFVALLLITHFPTASSNRVISHSKLLLHRRSCVLLTLKHTFNSTYSVITCSEVWPPPPTPTSKPCRRVHFPPDFIAAYSPRAWNSISGITVGKHMVNYFFSRLYWKTDFVYSFVPVSSRICGGTVFYWIIIITITAKHLIKITQADAPYLARVGG